MLDLKSPRIASNDIGRHAESHIRAVGGLKFDVNQCFLAIDPHANEAIDLARFNSGEFGVEDFLNFNFDILASDILRLGIARETYPLAPLLVSLVVGYACAYEEEGRGKIQEARGKKQKA